MNDTIYDALRESHETQRSLCRRLLRSKPGTRERLDLFTALRIELAAHAAAEERFLYVPILMDDRGLDSSRHALHEHHQVDELLQSGQLVLIKGDRLCVPREADLTLTEGRYHQVRRMFAATGNHVEELHRERLGGLSLPDGMAPGQWKLLNEDEIALIFQ